MNRFVSGGHAINLAHVAEVARTRDGSVTAFLVTGQTATFTGEDGMRLWRQFTGQETPEPTADDREWAAAEWRRLFPGDGHATEQTPVDALGEPPAGVVSGLWQEVG